MSELLTSLLTEILKTQATDLYVNVGSSPALRIVDRILAMRAEPLTTAEITQLCQQLLSVEQQKEFTTARELNISFAWNKEARFRVNFYYQQQTPGMVIRRIHTAIPTAESLRLPKPYTDMAMLKSGLVLVVGKAGSGKSTSLAAMIHHRNLHGSGHIITVEDPLEYIHTPNQCLFTQRDVGIDTLSFSAALKNALRQRPDVVMIGEIRDAEVMGQVLSMAESGHLCFATLHASSASQTIERIIDFFGEDRQQQVLKSLASHLRGIFAQRLVDTVTNTKILASEILLNEGAVPSLIVERKIPEIRDLIAKSTARGMHSFDQSLFELLEGGIISEKTALAEAESPNELSLRIRQGRAPATAATKNMRIAGEAVPFPKNGYSDLETPL